MDDITTIIKVLQLLEDNRDEKATYIAYYTILRTMLFFRKNDKNLAFIINSLDEAYKPIFQELEQESLIYENIIDYVEQVIGVSPENVEALYEYALDINDFSDERIVYSSNLFMWFLNIINNPIKDTKEYKYPKYESKLPEDALEKVLLTKIS